jgi:hypothetical protein
MKVTFQQSGGYAFPITNRGCELDTDLLPPDEAATLQSLVEQSGLLMVEREPTQDIYSQKPERERIPDVINYKITVQTSEGVHQVSFDDMTIPERIVQLVEYLQKYSKPLPLQ